MNNKSTNVQVHNESESQAKSIPKATVVFYIYIYIYLSIYKNERTCMNSNKLDMVKCEKSTHKYVPDKHRKMSKFFCKSVLMHRRV